MWQARGTRCWTQTNQSIPNSTHSSPCPMHVVQRPTQSIQRPTHNILRMTHSVSHWMLLKCHHLAQQITMRHEPLVNRRGQNVGLFPQFLHHKGAQRRVSRREPRECQPIVTRPVAKKPQDKLGPGTSAPCIEQFTPTVEMLGLGLGTFSQIYTIFINIFIMIN